MDPFKGLVSGPACAPDGTVNPLMRAVDSTLNSWLAGAAVGGAGAGGAATPPRGGMNFVDRPAAPAPAPSAAAPAPSPLHHVHADLEAAWARSASAAPAAAPARGVLQPPSHAYGPSAAAPQAAAAYPAAYPTAGYRYPQYLARPPPLAPAMPAYVPQPTYAAAAAYHPAPLAATASSRTRTRTTAPMAASSSRSSGSYNTTGYASPTAAAPAQQSPAAVKEQASHRSGDSGDGGEAVRQHAASIIASVTAASGDARAAHEAEGGGSEFLQFMAALRDGALRLEGSNVVSAAQPPSTTAAAAPAPADDVHESFELNLDETGEDGGWLGLDGIPEVSRAAAADMGGAQAQLDAIQAQWRAILEAEAAHNGAGADAGAGAGAGAVDDEGTDEREVAAEEAVERMQALMARLWREAGEAEAEADVASDEAAFAGPSAGAAAAVPRQYTLGDPDTNTYLTHPPVEAEDGEALVAALYARAVAAFDGGAIRDSIAAAEAVLHLAPEHAEAWRLLGTAHAEIDDDVNAILCLERAVDADPYNLPALLQLGVGYVNEKRNKEALATLRQWVAHHPAFHALQVPADEYSDGTEVDEVLALMMAAEESVSAALGPSGGGGGGGGAGAGATAEGAAAAAAAAAEVAEVLGVLYNVTRDYDAAAAALRRALALSGGDRAATSSPGSHSRQYALWNRLGATLANADQHAEALQAYNESVRLKPSHARAWLNAGMSHYRSAPTGGDSGGGAGAAGPLRQAARAYLQALRIVPTAAHMWTLLRMAFTALDRYDLVLATEACNPEVFAAEFGL